MKLHFFICLIGLLAFTTDVSAQSFLNKVKRAANKAAQEAVQKAKQDVEHKAKRDVEQKTNLKVTPQATNQKQTEGKPVVKSSSGNSTMAGGGVTLSPKKKEITIKLCRGLGPSTWHGRKNARSPQPPVSSKQDSW